MKIGQKNAMQHTWKALDDGVAAGAICPVPDCGALVIAFRATCFANTDHAELREFACGRCGLEFCCAGERTGPSVGANGLALRKDAYRAIECRKSHGSTSIFTKGAQHHETEPNDEYLTSILTQAAKPSDLQEQIRHRAYKLYEQRGRNDGQELGDWLQAESEVTQKKAISA